MGPEEISRAIRAKNEAWRRLETAQLRCMAYQRTRYTAEGYPELPEGWEERRAELRLDYEAARRRCRAALALRDTPGAIPAMATN